MVGTDCVAAPELGVAQVFQFWYNDADLYTRLLSVLIQMEIYNFLSLSTHGDSKVSGQRG